MNVSLFLNALSSPVSEVEQYVFLGNRVGAKDLNLLKQHGIRAVVQIQTSEVPPFFPGYFEYHRITMPDLPSVNILRVLPEAVRFINDAVTMQKKVFVHCDAGVSRSTSVVVAYLMATRRWSFAQAVEYVRGRRGCAFPNEGFQSQLESVDPNTMSSWLR